MSDQFLEVEPYKAGIQAVEPDLDFDLVDWNEVAENFRAE